MSAASSRKHRAEPVPGGNRNNAGVIIINFIYTDFNISLMIEIKLPHVKPQSREAAPSEELQCDPPII